jgi:hypothetical protein
MRDSLFDFTQPRESLKEDVHNIVRCRIHKLIVQELVDSQFLNNEIRYRELFLSMFPDNFRRKTG